MMQWITAPGGLPQQNVVFYARKRFSADADPGVLTITADSRYVAYLNGEYIGDGPAARPTDKRWFLDEINVTAQLREGENELLLHVYCPVTPVTCAVPPIAAAVIAHLGDMVATDGTWETCVDPAVRCDAPFYTHHISYSDYRDLRLEPSQWSAARVVEDMGDRDLVPCPIAPLTSELFNPVRIVDQGGVPPHEPGIEDDLEYAARMQIEMHLNPSRVRFSGGGGRITPIAALTPDGRTEGAYIIYDFGRELCGNLVLDIEGPAGAIVDVGFDEDCPNMRIDPRRINPNNTIYRFADRYILREGRQRIENRFHSRGMRYLQLVCRRFNEPITIHNVQMANRVYPMPLAATFDCDDAYLNQLWAMSVETMQACSLDVFVDGPWREQTLWIDDMLEESLFYLLLSSDGQFTGHNLRVAADGVMPDGQIPARYPSPRDSLLPVTSAKWIIALHDHWLHTGDVQAVRDLMPIVDGALTLYAKWRDADGLVPQQEGPGVWNMIDWGYDNAGVQLGGKSAALNMAIAAAHKAAGQMCAAVGDEARASQRDEQSKQIVSAVIGAMWDGDHHRLRDCTDPPDGRHTFSQVPHAVGLCYDLLPEECRAGAVEALIHPDAIECEFGYTMAMLDALARHGRGDTAMRILHSHWQMMVDAGSTTMWEVRDGRASMTGCGSLCHGFACTPIHFFATTLLGVRPTAPALGFAQFTFAPQSLGVQRAEGTIPTPHGPIRVAWRMEDGRMMSHIDVPEGTTAVLPDGSTLTPGSHEL